METPHASTPSFASFDLPPSLQQGLDDIGFSNCTEIQGLSLPHALNGKDVAGQAQTGTGKTAAFLIATYAKLLRTEPAPTRRVNQPRALILAPTRELAIQIHKDALDIGAHTGLELALAYGGVDYEKQRQKLTDGVDILVGTPGRIIDYFKQNVFDLQCLQVIVLDEADRMFDLGFIADIRYLLRRMPAPTERLSMLFSATLSHRVLELLRQMEPERSMVFVNTKVVADRLLGWLLGNGFKADVLSGDVRQTKRQRLLHDFGNGTIDILIGTDVAARGLHIPGVTHVFNYDLPQQQEDYVHRIGRTARAGAKGEAISFACEEYAFSLPDIEEYIGQTIAAGTITNEMLPQLDPPKRIARRDTPGGRDGKRSDGRRGDGRGGSRSGPRNGDRKRSSNRDGGREGSHRDKPREQPLATEAETAKPPAADSAADAQATSSEGTAAPKRRRRNRRRSRSGDADTTQTRNTQSGDDSAPSSPASADGEERKPRRRRGGRNRKGRKPAEQSAEQAPQRTRDPSATNPTSTPGIVGKVKALTRKLFGKS